MKLTCAAQTGVTFYDISGWPTPDGTALRVAAEADGSLSLVVDDLVPGSYALGVCAGNVWGVSTATGCTFERPAPLTAPADVRVG